MKLYLAAVYRTEMGLQETRKKSAEDEGLIWGDSTGDGKEM